MQVFCWGAHFKPARLLFYFILLLSGSMVAQSVGQLRNSYSGQTSWNSGTGELTFTSSGSIGKITSSNIQDSWTVPSNVTRIKINANVTVTGRFDVRDNLTIVGVNRFTSRLFGTNIRQYAKQNEGGDRLSAVRVTAGAVTINNLTSINPKGYHFTSRPGSGFFTITNCEMKDTRGGNKNNSDGVVTWGGGLVRNCVIASGDDAIKVYGDITVEDTEIVMQDNAVPIQLGWGDYGRGATGTFRNLTVSGNQGRPASGNAVISCRRGDVGNKTITIDGLVCENPNASLFSFRESAGNFNITMTNARINVGRFVYVWNNSVSASIKICGSNYNRNTTKTFWDCRGGGNQGGGGGCTISGVNTSKTNASCGANNGRITFAFANDPGRTSIEFSRDGGYSYAPQVSDASGSFSFNNLAPGTYSCFVRWGNNDCPTNLGNVTIGENCSNACTIAGVNISKTNASCGANNGRITFSFPNDPGRTNIEFSRNGGNSYAPQVSDASGSFSFDNLAAGTYSCSVRWGNNDCPTNLGNVTVGENCSAGNDGIFIVHKPGNRRLSSSGTYTTATGSSTGNAVQWKRVDAGNGYFFLVNRTTNRKLYATTSGVLGSAGPGSVGSNVQWKLVNADNGYSRIQHRASGLWLWANSSGTQVDLLSTGSTGDYTRWQFITSGTSFRPDNTAEVDVDRDALATSEKENALRNIVAYPNPTNGTLSLKYIEPGQTIRIFSLLGRQMMTARDTRQIDVSILPAGTYLLRVEGHQPIKFVKR